MCGSVLRPCVLDGVQTYNTEITFVLETLKPCLSRITLLGVSFVLSFDIFLDHVVSRHQSPEHQKMMALSPNNQALVSAVFAYSIQVLDLLSG